MNRRNIVEAPQKKRIVIGISGASGVWMGLRLLEILKARPDVETHLVLTDGAEANFRQETETTAEAARELADVTYDADDLGAAIASGTFPTDGMIVVPCSMKTLAGIVRAQMSPDAVAVRRRHRKEKYLRSDILFSYFVAV